MIFAMYAFCMVQENVEKTPLLKSILNLALQSQLKCLKMKRLLFEKPFPVILSLDVEQAGLLICENGSWFHGNPSHHRMIYYPVNNLLFL